MTDQQKMERLLRLLLLLAGGRSYTRAEIAERIGVKERTVYRYLNTIESVGLVLHRGNGYRLVATKGTGRSLNDLLHFSEEEAYMLFCLLEKAEGDLAGKRRLLSKLHALYDFHALVQLEGLPAFAHVSALKQAIAQRRQVVLQAYRSSNSQTIWVNLAAFFDYPLEIRKIIYTTNTIENLNRGIRKYTKAKVQFNDDQAALKAVYLAIVNIEKKWTMPIQNWGIVLHQFLTIFDQRCQLR